MKKTLLLLLPAVIFFAMQAAVPYGKLWKEVETLEKSGLPRSVSAKADSIANLAFSDGNHAEQLKALIYKAKSSYAIDESSLPGNIRAIAAFARSCPDTAVSAIADMRVAELYSRLMDLWRNKLPDGNIAEGADNLPVEQWSVGMFRDTISSYVARAVEHGRCLSKTGVGGYLTLLESGKDYVLRPSVYNVLVHKAIDLSMENGSDNVSALYDSLIASERGRDEAYAMAVLEKEVYGGKDLDSFIAANQDKDIVVYAFYLKALQMQDSHAAFRLCENVAAAYAGNRYLPFIENLLTSLSNPFVRAETSTYAYPGSRIAMDVTWRNVDGISLDVYKLSVPREDYGKYKYADIPDGLKAKVATYNYPLPSTSGAAEKDTVLYFDLPGFGLYRYELSVPGEKHAGMDHGTVCVSRFELLSQSRGGVLYCKVVDRKDGKPVAGVGMQLRNDGDVVANGVSDGKGAAEFKGLSTAESYRMFLTQEADSFYIPERVSVYRANTVPETERRMALFTDRKIYRPGQTVYFKGVVYDEGLESKNVLADENVDVYVSNPQRSEVMRQTYRSNSFGSFAGSYAIPEQSVSGRYLITAGGAYCDFEVQEYKRAGFNPYIEAIRGSYCQGDTVEVGVGVDAYSGIPVAGARLVVDVARRPLSLWRVPVGKRSAVQVFADTLTADGEGKARFALALASEGGDTAWLYEITVAATSPAGETQTAVKTISVGLHPFEILPQWNDIYDKTEGISFSARCQNNDGIQVDADLDYFIMQDGDTLQSGKTSTGTTVFMDGADRMRPGRYGLVIEAVDEKGRKVQVSRSFLLSDRKAKKTPVDTLLWLQPLTRDYSDAESFEFAIGSSEKVTVMCNLYGPNGLINQSSLNLFDNVRHYEIRKEEWFPSVFRFEVVAVCNGKTLVDQIDFNTIPGQRSLTLDISTFRDFVEPGTHEKWKISAKYADGTAARAEILLAMYDLALDRLAPNVWRWNNGRYFSMFFPSWRWQSGRVYNYIDFSGYLKPSYNFEFPELRDFGFSLYPYRYGALAMPVLNSVRRSASSDMIMSKDMAVAEESSQTAVAAGGAMPSEEVTMREDFAETAFFLPQLQCDSAGIAEFDFTTPADITSWKIMAVAHTETLETGVFADTVISRKILSVVQQLPRFVREGDEIVFAVQTANLSDKPVESALSWKISGPDGTVLQTADSTFILDAGGQQTLKFDFPVPENTDFLILESRLSGDGFSDGERRYLQVLPRQIPVTESKEFNMVRDGSYDFGLEGFAGAESSTMQPKTITMEFCSNPAWAALLSLPYITTAASDNSIETAAAVFANAKLIKIYSENVQFRSFLKVCGDLHVSPSLVANEEVKIADISATPWLRQSLELSLLPEILDSKKAAGLLSYYGGKLENMQLPSGAFPWFENGRENLHASLYVASMIKDMPRFAAMYDKLSGYLSSVLDKDMAEKQTLRPAHLQIMQHCADTESAAFRYYLQAAFSDLSKSSNSDKALAALAARRAGENEKAYAALESLREHAVDNDYEMYWPNGGSLQEHLAIMQAFAGIDPRDAELSRMGYHLLRHKRCNSWDDAPTTAQAVSMLLGGNGTALFDLDGSVEVKVNGEPLQRDGNSIPGYFNAVFKSSEIDLQDCRIEVEKQGSTPAWGAAYFVYTEDADKVRSSASGLKVEKQSYLVQPDGKLSALQDSATLRAGDKIRIRLVIKSPEEMDFVYLKDYRAAGMEPVMQKSGQVRQGGLWYFYDVQDDSCGFYFDTLPKGTHVVEYELYAGTGGKLNCGPAQIQCQYDPSKNANAEGQYLVVSD